MKKNSAVLLVLVVIAFLVGYWFQPAETLSEPTYEGKTAREWAVEAQNVAEIRDILIGQLDYYRSLAPTPKPLKWKSVDEFLAAYDAGDPVATGMADEEPVESTPTPVSQGQAIDFPEWCAQIVTYWTRDMGYSRSKANQMMKKDNPECAY